MNKPSAERTPDKKIDDEPQVTLQKAFKKVQLNFSRLEKYVGLCKEVLSECCDKLEELHSQMTELESMVEEGIKNGTQKPLDSSDRIKERNQLNEIADQNIIEDVAISEQEKPEDAKNSNEVTNDGNQRKKLKTNPLNDEISLIQEANYESAAGPSQETKRSRKECQLHSQENEPMHEILDLEMQNDIADDVSEMSLKNTEGVLSAQDLKSFLCLADEVEDPVKLAEVSFTADIEALYIQLMNLHVLLKVENDALEKNVPNLSRDLEVKVQKLINAFQMRVKKSQAELLRDDERAFQSFRRFNLSTNMRRFPM